MGDSYDGGEANDGAESSGSAENTDSGDDSSAFYGEDIGEADAGDIENSVFGGENEFAGETQKSAAPESAYGDDQGEFDVESTEHMEINESGDDESAYERGDVTSNEVRQDIPEELENEMPDEVEVDREGDEESAYEDEADDEQEDTEIFVEQDLEDEVYELGEFNEEELEALQERADNAAQEYNDKYSPYERAVSKGVEGVTETPNGGVSFENSDALYVTKDGKKGVITIEATGSRSADFDKANEALGLDEKPDGYTWHHLDNYNVKDNTVTLELVRDDAHNSAKPHYGGCAQYDAVHGPTYNPPR